MTDKPCRCSFCGESPAFYIEGFYLCESGQCDAEHSDACSFRESEMREEFESQFDRGY